MMAPSRDVERRRLRRFGLTVTVGFALIGAVSAWRGHVVAPRLLWTLAGLLAVPTLVAPLALTRVERAWLTLGGWLGWVNTRVILTIVFYAVIAPAGLVMRLFRDPLDRRLRESRPTYWTRRPVEPSDPASYERQF